MEVIRFPEVRQKILYFLTRKYSYYDWTICLRVCKQWNRFFQEPNFLPQFIAFRKANAQSQFFLRCKDLLYLRLRKLHLCLSDNKLPYKALNLCVNITCLKIEANHVMSAMRMSEIIKDLSFPFLKHLDVCNTFNNDALFDSKMFKLQLSKLKFYRSSAVDLNKILHHQTNLHKLILIESLCDSSFVQRAIKQDPSPVFSLMHLILPADLSIDISMLSHLPNLEYLACRPKLIQNSSESLIFCKLHTLRLYKIRFHTCVFLSCAFPNLQQLSVFVATVYEAIAAYELQWEEQEEEWVNIKRVNQKDIQTTRQMMKMMSEHARTKMSVFFKPFLSSLSLHTLRMDIRALSDDVAYLKRYSFHWGHFKEVLMDTKKSLRIED